MYLNKLNFQAELSSLLKESQNFKFLLALSGGADSMVLANLFNDLELNFQVAHINYKLRGEESDLDEKVVRNFCTKNNIKNHFYRVSSKDKKPQNSIQLWARNLRYTFFDEIKAKENLDYIVTAHHLNDELETFIINLSRASGLKGLSGIPKNNNQILRPLLKFSKQEIYDFAAENNIEFREDKSNKKSDYLRNFIRHEITPKLLETNKYFLKNFSKSLTYLDDATNFIAQEIEHKRKVLSMEINSKIIFDKNKLKSESNFVKFEILKIYGFNDLNEITKIFSAENGSRFQSKTHQLNINHNKLIIKHLGNIEEDFETIVLPIRNEIRIQDFHMDYIETGNIWKIDIEKIKWPIILRKPLKSDIFNPIGMRGRKKVSKFIKELKIHPFDFQILVLADADENVLGVVPNRQNGNFAANNSGKVLTIIL